MLTNNIKERMANAMRNQEGRRKQEKLNIASDISSLIGGEVKNDYYGVYILLKTDNLDEVYGMIKGIYQEVETEEYELEEIFLYGRTGILIRHPEDRPFSE